MDLLTWLSDHFQSIWENFIEILPKCPLYYLESIPEVKQYLGVINWFMPVSTMISIALDWLVCITIYYVVQVVLRWVKVIE